ncbi:MAG: substrate-binding periplasmic protein [Coriobacteriia bacterium]
MPRARHLIASALVLVFAMTVSGCTPQTEDPQLEPRINPPVIAAEGVLKTGVDLSYPPFAGTDDGKTAGIDVDVAAAIAERLGLRLELIDVPQAEMAEALSSGRIDIMLGATPITDAVLADVSSAGSYLIDAPAIFSLTTAGSAVATLTVDDLPGRRVGAQNGSPSFWELESEFGEGFPSSYETLRGAFEALTAGEVDVVVASAAVGAYLARDFDSVAFSGQFAPGVPLGVAVRKDATELETEIRSTLDALAADGTLDTIRGKWLGDLPQLDVPPAG